MSNQETIDKYYKYLNNYQLADLFLSLKEKQKYKIVITEIE